MKKALTQSDIEELRYQCRMGYLLPAMFFLLGNILVGGACFVNFGSDGTTIEMLLIIVVVFACLALLMGYKMNWKYISDIAYMEKQVVTKIIQRKEAKRDYEAGSGTMYLGQEMNGFDSYSIIVENTRYRVDEELYLACAEGGEVLFNYAPKSRYRLSIEVKKKARS